MLIPNSINFISRQKCSLNEISHNSAIGLIQRVLDRGVNICEVYVDTVGPAEKYQVRIILFIIFNKNENKKISYNESLYVLFLFNIKLMCL